MNLTKETRETRYEARCTLIINMARECFQKQGMRGTSMSDIARHCQLGIGQIYRCFKNKEEIIREIVRRIVRRRVNYMIAENHNLGLKAQEFAGTNPDNGFFNLQDDALLLEIYAEAAHNPGIAQILNEADDILMQEGYQLLKKHYPALSDGRLMALSEMMAVLAEGTLLRRHSRHSRHIYDERKVDRKALLHLYQQLLNYIFIIATDEPSTLDNSDGRTKNL